MEERHVPSLQMRREDREEIGRPAWLKLEAGFVDCHLIDLSRSGAKLAVDDPAQLPDRFTLWLSRYGHPRYPCQVVWRTADSVGVRFASD